MEKRFEEPLSLKHDNRLKSNILLLVAEVLASIHCSKYFRLQYQFTHHSMINPYQPSDPTEIDHSESGSPFVEGLKTVFQEETPSPASKPRPLRMFGKWSLICTLSALPSFMLGSLATQQQYLAMATGIFLFICGYVWLDRYTWNFPWRQNLVIRRILRIMYSTRVIISCSMIGTPLDMVCGVLSMSIATMVTRPFGNTDLFLGGDPIESFIGALIATIVQGTLLNAILIVYGFLLLGIFRLYKVISNRRQSSGH